MITWGTTPPGTARVRAAQRASRPGSEFAVLAGMVCVGPQAWYGSSDEKLVARGIVITCRLRYRVFILHRSRFCTARAFRATVHDRRR